MKNIQFKWISDAVKFELVFCTRSLPESNSGTPVQKDKSYGELNFHSQYKNSSKKYTEKKLQFCAFYVQL